MAIINTGLPFSASTHGKPIIISSVSNPGQIIHLSDSTADDYVTLYASNPIEPQTEGEADPRLFLIIGTAATGYTLDDVKPIPYEQGKIEIIPGILLTSGMEVRIYSDMASRIRVTGFVHRRSGEESFI